MTRALLPGRWHRDGARPSLPRCSGSCDQGRKVCDCAPHIDLHRITLTELDLELGPDDQRVIAPPAPKLLTRTQRDRARDVVKAVMALALLAFGLWIYPHH